MKITQEEVTHVANLSKLRFSEEETRKIENQRKRTYEYSRRN
ncbi:aspartyl/glutamyl-tRNA amidotransferase subunit C [Streptococcus pneumoniae]|nr:aspartyl/glutamyl-tRNA amidotransferase subunit C [Streptococcus pneumoniae]CKB92090.1 aspartyl/glutamyl-tRNA amidotransferase subunit C [Streptococcus pneumoniae]